jgi:hypothetical protein
MNHGAERRLTAVCAGTALAILALVLLAAPAVAETRVCVTSTVSEPFVMPGGFEHAPGNLRLCHGPEYSPSRMMHVGYVDRAPVGMLFSRRGLSEAPTETRPYMVFGRDRQGRLHLYGFSVPGTDGMETFLIEGSAVDPARLSKQVARNS